MKCQVLGEFGLFTNEQNKLWTVKVLSRLFRYPYLWNVLKSKIILMRIVVHNFKHNLFCIRFASYFKIFYICPSHHLQIFQAPKRFFTSWDFNYEASWGENHCRQLKCPRYPTRLNKVATSSFFIVCYRVLKKICKRANCWWRNVMKWMLSNIERDMKSFQESSMRQKKQHFFIVIKHVLIKHGSTTLRN